MADLSITAANVVAGTNAKTKPGVLGETVTAGMPVVRDPTTRKYVKSDANHATAALRGCDGIALNGGALNQPVLVQEDGDINVGATLTVGESYYVSDTAGGIMPKADLSTGETATLLGIATASDNLRLGILNSGAQVP